jgi:hypothetical protein
MTRLSKLKAEAMLLYVDGEDETLGRGFERVVERNIKVEQ